MMQDISIALFRRPGESPQYIAQTTGELLQLNDIEELDNKSGYVFAPFQISKSSPLILISPTEEGKYNEQTKSYIKNILFSENNLSPKLFNREEDFLNYSTIFNLFKQELVSDKFFKLVLSRSLVKHKPIKFNLLNIFEKACELYPLAYIYICHTPVSGTWFGCTPEILLKGSATAWHTVALAGTQKIKDENKLIKWDQKNINEQQLVKDYIENQLCKLEIKYSYTKPYNLSAGNLVHLKSDFTCIPPKSKNIGKFVKYLHPTPATCGLPKEEAHEFILNNEGYNRSYYAGFCGMVTNSGDVDLHVNLRCMQIHNSYLELYAGGGILNSSELEAEWNETEDKLQTLLSIID